MIRRVDPPEVLTTDPLPGGRPAGRSVPGGNGCSRGKRAAVPGA
ncbi:hypothetical protein QJS66_21785 [Kocuria rhizophila]|nr:hypothetical protein QJS66_21785 [Kocuria rhizophila]